MAFPTVRSQIVTDGTTASATPAINLPATVAGGDVLFVVFRVAVAGAIGWPDATWNELFDTSDDASDDQWAAAWKVATGGESGTTITLSCTSGKFAAVAYAIAGTQDPRVRAPELSTVATGAGGTQPNATTVTPTGGAKDYLWLTFAGQDGEATVPPTYPANYTVAQLSSNSGTGGLPATNVRIGAAVRTNNNAASEDAAAWSYGGTTGSWTAYTIAFHPNVALDSALIGESIAPPPRTMRRPNPPTMVAAGLALLTTVADPFNRDDWPAPPPKPRPVVTTINTRPSSDSTTPFLQTEWPPPEKTPFYVGKVAFTFGPIPSTLDTVAALPFSQTQWPPPFRTAPTSPDPAPSLLQSTLAPVAVLPFSQSQWPPPYRPQATSTDPSVPLLQTTLAPSVALPPFIPQWPAPKRRPPWPIVTTVTRPGDSPIAALPFNQPNWPRPQYKRPLGNFDIVSTPPAEEVEPPPPFIPVSWRKPDRRQPWPITTIVTRPGDSPEQPPAADQPFGFRDWRAPARAKPRPLSWVSYVIIDDSVPFIPVAWPKPQIKRELRDRTWGANHLQFTLSQVVVPPFIPGDWPQPQRKTERRDQSYGVNLVLGRVAEVVPIGRAGLSTPGFLRQPPPFDWAPNLPLIQNVGVTPPFIPVEWPKPQRSKPQPAAFDWPPNSVLRQVAEIVPIGRAGISVAGFLRQPPPFDWAPNLPLIQNVGVTPPFIPIEWPKPQRSKPQPAPFDWAPNNVLRQIAEALPIGRAVTSPPTLRIGSQSWALNLLQSTLSDVVPPFIPVDWPAPGRRNPARLTDVAGLTLAVLEQRPFSLTEWPIPTRRSTRAADVQLPLVLTTLQVLPLPFNQAEWPKPAPKRAQPKYYDLPNNVLRQIREALPFNQSDWPQPVWIRWESSNRGTTEEGIIRITSLSVINVSADVVIQVRPEATLIYIRPDGTWIQVKPDTTDLEI